MAASPTSAKSWKRSRRGGLSSNDATNSGRSRRAGGYSCSTIEIETLNDTVKLSIVHEIDASGTKFIEAVSGGWQKIISSVKSLLEMGRLLR